jgi:TctA family transporter
MIPIDAIIEGLLGILEPKAFALMLMGLTVSSFFAAVPGIGAILFLSMMIPYAITLEPYQAIALTLGIATVSNTANTFPSVLIAVPGSSGSQATVVDGFPMARKGEARRALGAAFAASGMGALFGAVVFVLSLPVLYPLVLAVGSPELMMLILWGLSAVAMLTARRPIKGLLAAVVGLALALIGVDGRTGIARFTFGDFYLWEGPPLVIVALGLFAMPELIALAARKSSVSDTTDLGSGTWEGVKDVFRNWWLVIRCSAIGVWVGAMPGLGSSVADWFAYAHAAQSCRNNKTFGTGDVRGVIAPESSNNAKEGGALIPTTLFGIPGSASFALILFVFIAVGIQPGREIVTGQINYLFAMVWVLVIANLIATSISIAFTNTFARASLLPFHIIFPVTLVLCFIGAFSITYDFKDIAALMLFSLLGYFMKRYDWPRPPVLLAVVLGPQFETYLWLTVDRYEMAWIGHPGVLIVLALILITVVIPVCLRLRRQARDPEYAAARAAEKSYRPFGGDVALVAIVVLALAGMAYQAADWPIRGAITTYVVATAGGLLGLSQMALFVRARARARAAGEGFAPVTPLAHEWEVAVWVAGLIAAIWLLGFHAAFLFFPIVYTRYYGGSWRAAVFLGALALAALMAIYDVLIKIVWPVPGLLELLGLSEVFSL